MTIQVHRVRAFIDGTSGGNPAGVVLDADALDRDARQSLAAKLGWSETAFASRSDRAAVRLEFFTPNRQIAHCGHATVATFGLLRAQGKIGEGTHYKDTVDGLREVRIQGEDIFMAQQAPTFEAQPGLNLRLENLLDLPRDAFDHAEVATVVNTGTRFLHVGPIDAEFLAHARPQQREIERLSEELDLIGLYVHARGTLVPGRAATTRMFAPRFGINEEAATGMAAGGLAALLAQRGVVDSDALVIEQGRLMRPPSPAELQVRLEREGRDIRRVFVGGRVLVETSRELEFDAAHGQWREVPAKSAA